MAVDFWSCGCSCRCLFLKKEANVKLSLLLPWKCHQCQTLNKHKLLLLLLFLYQFAVDVPLRNILSLDDQVISTILENHNNGDFFVLQYRRKEENDEQNEASHVRSYKHQFFTYSAEMHRPYPEGTSKSLRVWACVNFKQSCAFIDLMETEDAISVSSNDIGKKWSRSWFLHREACNIYAAHRLHKKE